MNKKLTLAYSPCPNDTFIFYAIAHGKIPLQGLEFDITLADVETLNQEARAGKFDVSKLSFAALGHLLNPYGLIRSGAALGRGCGPLIVAKQGFDPSRLGSIPIAVPGIWTTACMLLGLYLGQNPKIVSMSFDQIMPAVTRGEFEAGVIIHEGRFTFQNHGLKKLTDLGEWWEHETGLPIPLGGIAIRRDLGPETARQVEDAIRESLIYAFEHRDSADEYIKLHAQEMEPSVIHQHIDLYVNDFSLNLGKEGEDAIAGLFNRAMNDGLLPAHQGPIFAC
jgi:1,4-dihydroxy-6-naphthoate synthase